MRGGNEINSMRATVHCFKPPHRQPDGSIDFDAYRSEFTALRRQAMRDGATLKAAFKFTLLTIGVLGLVVALAATPRQHALEQAAAKAKISERLEVLGKSDPQRWWDGYGKSTTRGQAAAVAELQKQLGKNAIAAR